MQQKFTRHMKLPKSVPDRGPLLPLGILSPSSLHFVESDMMSTFVRRRESTGVPRAGLEVSHIPHHISVPPIPEGRWAPGRVMSTWAPLFPFPLSYPVSRPRKGCLLGSNT